MKRKLEPINLSLNLHFHKTKTAPFYIKFSNEVQFIHSFNTIYAEQQSIRERRYIKEHGHDEKSNSPLVMVDISSYLQ